MVEALVQVPGGVRAGVREWVGRVVRWRGVAVGDGFAFSSWGRACARAAVVWVVVIVFRSQVQVFTY